MSTTSSHRPPPKPQLDLELTIISAKHLKNVNWKNGDLSPYVIFWLDPNHRLATKSDDLNNTKPVWNERFTLPIPSTGPTGIPTGNNNNILTLEVFHSKPSDTPKPLVGSLRVPLNDVFAPDETTIIKSYDLHRPSGRPNGKIKLRLVIKPRPVPDNYQITPPQSYYYQNTPPQPTANYNRYPPPPPPPAASPYAPPHTSYHHGMYSDPYSGYYQSGYYAPASSVPQTPRSYSERYGGGGGVGGVPSAPVDTPRLYTERYGGGGVVGGGPSAPLDYVPPHPAPAQTPRLYTDRYGESGGGPSAPLDYAQYDQKQKSGRLGLGVGAVAGAMGGLVIDEGLRYEEEKVAESEVSARELDDYSDYRRRADY